MRKIGRYSEVQIFARVYLKLKYNQLSKGALYRKLVQYRIELSTKHPSETNYNFESCYLKSIIFGKKKYFFYNIPIKIKIFCYQKNIGIK